MPIVNVQGFGTVQFPDEMAPDAIEAAIRADIEPLIDQRRRIAAGQAAAQLPPVSPNWEGVKGAARRTLADPLLSAAKGIVGVPEAAVGAADILTGGGAGKLAESAGVNFKGTQDILSGLLSPEQQAANARVQQAKGFLPTVQAALENPSTIAHQVIEATPSMLAGGAVARGAIQALPKLSPLAAGAIGEGAITAGQMAEQVRQEQPSKLLTWEQAGLALAGGTLTGAIGGASGKLAERLGIKNLETILAGGGDLATKRGRLAQVIGGALTEGALEELPQSAQEQVVQNLAQGKPWNEGVAEAAASGLLAGMAMGAGFNAMDTPAVPKTGTAQPPVPPDVTPPAPEQPKVEVTRDLAKELQAALTGNQGKAPPVTPDVTPPAPAPPAGPLRFRAIVEEGKVPSELVIQPLTEELYDAVIHVPGLTPDFDQFKAENPEATHLKRQLLPTGKFASGHKFGPLNELVPPGIGSQWEDITNPEPSTKNQAPPAPTSPPPPAAPVKIDPYFERVAGDAAISLEARKAAWRLAKGQGTSEDLQAVNSALASIPRLSATAQEGPFVKLEPAAPAPPAPAAAAPAPPAPAQTPQALPSSPAGDSLAAALTPPAAAPTVTPVETETVTAGTAGREAGTQGGKAPTASPTPANSGLATEPGVSPGPISEISQAGRTSLGKAASRVTNGRYRQSTTTDADGLLHTLGSLGLKLPYFKPDRGAVTYFEKLTAKARRNEPLTPKEKAALERFRRTFPVNFEDNYGPGGEIMEAAYQAAQRAGLAVELFTEQRGQFGGEWDTKLDELRAATGKNWTLRELFEAIPPLAEGHRSRVRGETSAEENAQIDKRAEQDMAFQRDQNRPGNGTELIPPDDLREGMSYTLDGRKLRVTDLDIDEDGRVVAVELEDGDRYGTQRLLAEDGSEVPALRADTGSAVGTASQKRAEQQEGGAFSRLTGKTVSSQSQLVTNEDRAAQPEQPSPGSPNEAKVEFRRVVERQYGEPLERTVADVGGESIHFSQQGDSFRLTSGSRFGRTWWVNFDRTGKILSSSSSAVQGMTEPPLEKLRPVISNLAANSTPPHGTAEAFIRYGPLPKSGQSKNHVTGQTELGLSVYRAKWNPAFRSYELADADHASTAVDLLIQGKTPGLYTGDVIGRGSDGEPLIQNPKLIARLNWSENGYVFNPSEASIVASSRGTGSGVSVESAQARADELTAKWVLPFGVEVVQSWRDLPARAQRGITEQDGHTVEGRYVPGSGVFLVADNLASADRVSAVVLHEVLGHFGVDTVLGEQRDAFMLDVFRSFQGTPLFQQKVRDYAGDFENGRTPVTQADKILLGRELVAALAENPAENPGLWQRIVDAVRRWLRDIGWVQDVTEADIREALRRADREMRGEMSNVQRPTSNVQPAYASRLEPRELSELGFYDTILEALKRWQPKGTPEQLMAHLAKTRGALEQAEWIGLPEFLKGKPTVTNAEVAQFTRDNAVEVREVVKGANGKPVVMVRFGSLLPSFKKTIPGYSYMSRNTWIALVDGDFAGSADGDLSRTDAIAQINQDRQEAEMPGVGTTTKFSNYQLPGGENYRELLLTLPPRIGTPTKATRHQESGGWAVTDERGNKFGVYNGRTEAEALENARKTGPTDYATRGTDTFRSTHFDEPNILAHVRFNERTDAQGRRVLFIEEVQSDWHKEGRKQGYAKARWTDAEEARVRELESPRPYPGLSAEERAEYAALISKTGQTGVPDAPFKGTWPMLVMKRMLRWAAENNFDSVAWITGDQTAERYDLSKQVDSVRITRLFGNKGWTVEADKGGREVISKQAESEQELEALVGKDLAAKAVQDGGGTYSGVDLKVGGEWARSLYDRTLPNELNKFVKKWGGKVERAEIVTVDKPVRIVERGGNFSVMVGDSDAGRFGSRALAEEHAAGFGPQKETVHSLTLTPDLKDAALGGMPLFARTVQPEPRESDDLPKRVGTRNASGENATEDALRDQTVINVAAMRKDPKLVAKVEALIRAEYPQLRLAEGQDPIEALTQFVEANLVWLHNQMDPEVRARAKLWYDGARKIVLQWEQQYGRPREAVAAVIAKLSPQRDWFQNLELAERVIAITNQLTGDEKLTDEMDQEILSWVYKKPTAKQVETPEKKARFYANQAAFAEEHFAMRHVAYRDMNPWQKAVFVRAYSSTALPNRYNIWTPEGERLGFKYKKPETKTKKPKPLEEAKLGWPGFDTIAGAISILENPTLQNISDTLGNEHKIRNFYNNIILPNSEYGDVTIDTHAVAAALLKALAGDDMEVGHNFGTGAPSSDVIGVSGLYAIYADAYRRAAAQLGLQPRQLQSITWEEIRALFTEEFKAQEANKQLVENVWQRYAAGNLTLEEARNEIKALATDSQPDWVGVQSGAPATQAPWTLPDRGQLSGVRRYFEGRPRQRRSEEFAAALNQAADRRAGGLSPFSRTSQPTEPLPDLLARRDDAAARGITYAAQREKLRSEGKTIPESLKKAEREQADIFKEASFQLLRHPDYVAQQVRAVDDKLDELNTLKERQRILKQQGTDLESDARARLAELEQWLPIETGEIPYGNADEFVGIPPSLVKQAIERTSGLKHFVTEAEKERVRAILDNPDLSPEQKDRLLADLERNRGRALAEVPLPNALPPRANVALATSTTLAGNQDARGWWESFARWARNLASATPEIPLTGPLARLNVPMRGFLNAIRAGNMTAARDAEAMVQDVVQPLLALPRMQLDPNALARHQAIARKLQAAERQFDQQAERMRAEIAAMEQARADRAAITERREALAEFEGNPPAKIAELQKQLAEAVDKLGTNPMWLFKQAVLFRDYVSRFQMLAPKQQGRFKFPGNLSIQDVVNELERTNAAIEASPARAAIKEAMDRHYRAMAEMEAELLERGHIIPEAMKNGAYFPHQVLDYTSQHLGRLKPATEAPFRGYLVDPTGSRKAIETDYIQAVYRHAAEVMAHNAHQDAVEKYLKPLDRSKSIRETVEAKAAAEGRTAGRFEWRSEDNLPPGFVFYDAAKKLPLRLGYVLDPQTIAQALGIALKDGDVVEQMRKLGVDFVVEPEMLQQALVAGEKQPWVIPKEVAEALDGILDRQKREEAAARAPVTRRLRQAVALWKLNTLFAPWHYIRYEWGNTMSDIVDKLGGADPGMAKYLPQAFKEVIAFAARKEATKDVRAAFEQRVLDSVTFAEVEKVKDSPAFEQLRSDTQRALATAGNVAKGATFPAIPIIRLLSGANVRSTVELSRLREATFRYAKFLADLDRIRNGQRPVYAGAYWKDVEAEGTPEEKAAFIARRTFGDYGDLSVAGEYLRRNLVPFWSWTEINFRYHVNLLRNMADMIRKGEFGDAAQSARAMAAWTALRLALPYAAVHLWNTVGGAMAGAWDDDDDLEATLSDADRRRFHLILGKDERGQTKVVYMPTAFSDVVSWFGGDNAARLLAEYARGDITFERVVGDFAKQIGPDTLNKVAQSTGPIGKGAFIAVSGKQPFPDITNMRSVGGREKWFAVVQTMTDREGTDLLRRAFDNDYYPRPAGEVAQQLILQIRRRDPEQWAFYEVKEKVSQWKEQKTGKRFEAGDYQAPEAQALRGFRRAVYLGDVDAAERFYNRLLGFGYTSERLKASIRNQHPLAELNEEGRKEFINGLSRADREQLRRALQYWERLSTLKGKERGMFPAKPGQRFTPQPERLRNAVESFDRRSDEDVERTARRLMDAALAGRR